MSSKEQTRQYKASSEFKGIFHELGVKGRK